VIYYMILNAALNACENSGRHNNDRFCDHHSHRSGYSDCHCGMSAPCIRRALGYVLDWISNIQLEYDIRLAHSRECCLWPSLHLLHFHNRRNQSRAISQSFVSLLDLS
jgi:hypothetical protein